PVAADGDAYIVATGATGDWSGQDGNFALFLNGGWAFVSPWEGCRAWIADERAEAVYDEFFVTGHAGGSPGGAVTTSRIVEIDVQLSGAVVTTNTVIPDKAVVLGVTGRVTDAVTGVDGWSLGVPGAADRYGINNGIALNAWAHGVTGQPQAYYGDTSLEITAENGSFTGGSVRLAVHLLDIAPPSAV
ncbi:MAG: DUF2793 domain-containing protein, partial [Pseudomonadota bacterium]